MMSPEMAMSKTQRAAANLAPHPASLGWRLVSRTSTLFLSGTGTHSPFLLPDYAHRDM